MAWAPPARSCDPPPTGLSELSYLSVHKRSPYVAGYPSEGGMAVADEAGQENPRRIVARRVITEDARRAVTQAWRQIEEFFGAWSRSRLDRLTDFEYLPSRAINRHGAGKDGV